MISKANGHFLAYVISNDWCVVAGKSSSRGITEETTTFKPTAYSRALWQGLALACVIAGSAATHIRLRRRMSGRQDESQRARESRLQTGRCHDVTLGSIDLEKQPAHLKDRELRFRKLTTIRRIVPCIATTIGQLSFSCTKAKSSNTPATAQRPCAQGRRHQARVFGTSHWWKNLALRPSSLCRRRPQGSARPQYVTSAPQASYLM